jgi:ribosome-binding factor A
MSRESFARKVDEQVRETVAAILAVDISDPRVDFVTVTGAKVSPDKSVASVYVAAAPGTYDQVLDGLESAKGHIRSRLGRSLGWRVSPELRFFIDASVDESERIAEALTNVPPTLADGVGAEPSVPEDE